ncbi:hypothetical protein [Bacillus niameyensis]|uniref:hypothetical protein n=1 Tax=Bacillus niameyensis TaxID=1522308 RepID=UPI000781D6D6|nr:hypothetical protein [Bacillus niameyensis]
MTNLKTILLCVQVNFRKWLVNPRIYVLAVITVAFLAYHSSGLSQFATEKEVGIAPWIFPHLSLPPTMQVFACFIVLLFCDAPFADRHMPFLAIRTSRRNWVIGQLVYIILASFIYTAFICVMAALVLIPNLEFSKDWGILMKTLAMRPEMAPVNVTVFFNPDVLKMFSPFQAMIISFGLFWLVSVFIGVLIFCFNVVIEKMSGLVASGVFIFMSLFSIVEGRFIFGDWIGYLSPISWMNISYLDWKGTGLTPTPTFAVFCLVITSVFMGILSTIIFCRKDMKIQDWGY